MLGNIRRGSRSKTYVSTLGGIRKSIYGSTFWGANVICVSPLILLFLSLLITTQYLRFLLHYKNLAKTKRDVATLSLSVFWDLFSHSVNENKKNHERDDNQPELQETIVFSKIFCFGLQRNFTKIKKLSSTSESLQNHETS